MDLRQRAMVEATAHVGNIVQLAIAIKTDYQRAKMGTRSAWFGVAANHDFRTLHSLNLQPVFAASLHVWTGGTLGDHAFQMELLDLLEEGFAIARDMVREFDETCRPQNLFQGFLSF